MNGSPYNIIIQVGLNGLRNLLLGFQRISVAAGRITTALRLDLGRIAGIAGTAASSLLKISAAGGAVASLTFGAFIAGLAKARSIADEVAERLNLINTRAQGGKIGDKIEFDGLVFAAGQSGIQDAETVIGAVAGLQAALRDLKSGSEDAQLAFSNLNGTYEDFFDQDGNILSAKDLFINISRLVSELPETVNIAEALIPIFGETDAFEFARFFDRGPAFIEAAIEENKRLAPVFEADFVAAEKYIASKKRLETARQGIDDAFFRGFNAQGSAFNNDIANFFSTLGPQAEQFGERVGKVFQDLTPKVIEFVDTLLNLISGNGATLADTPLKRALIGVGIVITAIGQGLQDVADYLQGNPPAPWLETLILVFTAASDALKGFATLYTEVLAPAIGGLTEILSGLYEMLGVDGAAKQVAITVALLAFSGTIISITTNIGKLIGALGKLLGPLKTGALIVGQVIGGTVFSVEDFRKQFEVASKKAEELGGEAGKAYLLAFLEETKGEFQLFEIFNDGALFLGDKLGIDLGFDVDAAIATLKTDLANADPVAIKAAIEAVQTDREKGGVLDIESSATSFTRDVVDGAKNAGSVLAGGFSEFLENAQTFSPLTSASLVFEGAVNNLVDSLSQRLGFGAPVSIGDSAAATQTPVNIVIPGVGNLPATAQGGEIDRFSEAVRRSQRAAL